MQQSTLHLLNSGQKCSHISRDTLGKSQGFVTATSSEILDSLTFVSGLVTLSTSCALSSVWNFVLFPRAPATQREINNVPGTTT